MRSTEHISARYHNLDAQPCDEILTALWQDQLASVAAIQSALTDLEEAVRLSLSHLENGGRLIYAGAGSSGALALLDAFELRGTFGWPEERLETLVAGFSYGLQSTFIGGFEDDFKAGVAAANALKLTKNDVVIAVAASGSTPYTLGVCDVAHSECGLLIGIANNSPSELLNVSHLAISVETGPEVLAGSTRLGAGTAQRAVLGMYSTALMTKLGHVYNNTMVNLIADNTKLIRRAISILEAATAKSTQECEVALKESNGSVKIAMLVLSGCSVNEAINLLANNRENVREALAARKQKIE